MVRVMCDSARADEKDRDRDADLVDPDWDGTTARTKDRFLADAVEKDFERVAAQF
jgi:hypothetical protein